MGMRPLPTTRDDTALLRQWRRGGLHARADGEIPSTFPHRAVRVYSPQSPGERKQA